jgi:Membrane-associated phospholipid phosphatase
MDILMQFEIQITLFFQHLGTWLTIPFRAITALGNEEFYILVFPALYWCVDATLGFRMGVMLVFSNTVNGFFKTLFHSPRPFWVDSRVKAYSSETSFGLPSGHSQNAAAIWGIFAATLKKKWITVVCCISIFLIGISRIFLGVHFTRDVLTGWLIGLILIFVYLWLEKPIQKWIQPKSLTVKIGLIFLVSLLIIGIGYAGNATSIHWPFPSAWTSQAIAAGADAPDPYNMEGTFTIAGVWFGFTAGYAWLLAKKGNILIQGTTSKKVARYLVGLVGVGLLYLGLKLVFPTSPEWFGFVMRYVRYALIGIWVSAVAPLLFEKMKLDI